MFDRIVIFFKDVEYKRMFLRSHQESMKDTKKKFECHYDTFCDDLIVLDFPHYFEFEEFVEIPFLFDEQIHRMTFTRS